MTKSAGMLLAIVAAGTLPICRNGPVSLTKVCRDQPIRHREKSSSANLNNMKGGSWIHEKRFSHLWPNPSGRCHLLSLRQPLRVLKALLTTAVTGVVRTLGRTWALHFSLLSHIPNNHQEAEKFPMTFHLTEVLAGPL